MTAAGLMAAVIVPIAQYICFLALPLMGFALLRMISRA